MLIITDNHRVRVGFGCKRTTFGLTEAPVCHNRWLRPTSDELGLKGQAAQVVPIPAKEQEQAYTGGEGGEQQ